MKVYVVLERGDVHAVLEDKGVAELLAKELGAETIEAELNLMIQSHWTMVEEILRRRIDEAQKRLAADIKMLELLRGNI